MSYTVSQAITDFEGRLHGTSANKVANLDELMDSAARQLIMDVDLQETIRIQPLPNALFDKVYDVQLPADVNGDRIIDIRPQANASRTVRDNINLTYNKNFDIYKGFAEIWKPFASVVFNSGVKTLRVAKSSIAGKLISSMDTTDGWTTGGVATNLQADNVRYLSGAASLEFDISGAGTATLTNSTLSAVDMTGHVKQASEFYWICLSEPTKITSVALQWGTDASNYYSATATTDAMGNTFATGWNLIRFDWINATLVGNPTITSYTYAEVSVVATGAITGIRVDNIISCLPTLYEIEYYSKYLFADATTGAWKERHTSRNDLLNLDTDSYNLYLEQCTIKALRQMQAAGASVDIQSEENQYAKDLSRYKDKYKSQINKPKQQYYRPNYVNTRNFIKR